MAIIVDDDARNELGIGERRLRHRGASIAGGRNPESAPPTAHAEGG